MPQHSGEEHQSKEVLQYNEEILALVARPRQIPDGRQRQRTPVVALQVLFDHVGTLGVTEHPVFRPETVVFMNDVKQTAVPVEDHQQIMDKTGGTEEVWIIGVPLGAVHERPEAIDLYQAKGAQDRVEADRQVEEVQRQ